MFASEELKLNRRGVGHYYRIAIRVSSADTNHFLITKNKFSQNFIYYFQFQGLHNIDFLWFVLQLFSKCLFRLTL